MSETSTDLFRGFFDDAALFPPGELPLEDAVPAHRDHRAAWYAAMVGLFVFPANVIGYVEVPRDERRPSILDALTDTGYRAKFRTGGVVPEAHPSEPELAGAIAAVIERGLVFKCTAGLHHAVRHTDGALEQHGFLNVLLATDAALRGAGADDLASLLAERSGETIAEEVRAAGHERLAAARESFVSFGTCSITDPVRDLMSLGLVHKP